MNNQVKQVVYAVILSPVVLSLLMVKVKNKPYWILPGGKIEDGETKVEALLRELNEELDGLSLADLVDGEEPAFLFSQTGFGRTSNSRIEAHCFLVPRVFVGPLNPSGEIEDVKFCSFLELTEMEMTQTTSAIISRLKFIWGLL